MVSAKDIWIFFKPQNRKRSSGVYSGSGKKAGFVPFESDKNYAPGDKVYYVNREKAVILAVIGKRALERA